MQVNKEANTFKNDYIYNLNSHIVCDIIPGISLITNIGICVLKLIHCAFSGIAPNKFNNSFWAFIKEKNLVICITQVVVHPMGYIAGIVAIILKIVNRPISAEDKMIAKIKIIEKEANKKHKKIEEKIKKLKTNPKDSEILEIKQEILDLYQMFYEHEFYEYESGFEMMEHDIKKLNDFYITFIQKHKDVIKSWENDIHSCRQFLSFFRARKKNRENEVSVSQEIKLIEKKITTAKEEKEIKEVNDDFLNLYKNTYQRKAINIFDILSIMQSYNKFTNENYEKISHSYHLEHIKCLNEIGLDCYKEQNYCEAAEFFKIILESEYVNETEEKFNRIIEENGLENHFNVEEHLKKGDFLLTLEKELKQVKKGILDTDQKDILDGMQKVALVKYYYKKCFDEVLKLLQEAYNQGDAEVADFIINQADNGNTAAKYARDHIVLPEIPFTVTIK